ncbi:MAG: DUF4959 domain-containing protein [Prevotellaceae bacterium]|jgi:hypothetical protein|nr:DUF4959 domain-containing protein [Prevotellaceae bacterium]
MKRIILILFCIALVTASCKEETFEQGGGTAPAVTIEAAATADHGAVILSWTGPEDVNYYYTNVEWTNSKGQKRSIQSSKFAVDSITGIVTVVADGFTDTQSYTFTLTPHNSAGAAGKSSQISCAPLEPAYKIVLPTVTLVPDFGGVTVSWQNNTGKDLTIEIEYIFEDGSKRTKTIKALKTVIDGRDAITGFTQGAEHSFTVSIKDRFENRSEEKIINEAVLSEQKIDKLLWEIPGYNGSSANGTIGYSSQATNEGALKSLAIFDDNVSTYWHASWSSPSTVYPHWYIIDMGREVTISRIELTRRQGNAQGQKGQTFYTCTEANRQEPNGLDGEAGWVWQNQGHFTFDHNTNNFQSFRLINNPTARYVKVYFGVEDKGAGNYAMVAEMNVYGQE